MELRQLRYFVTVVEEGGFTRAAERLHLTQPGLSAQIKQLERALGQQLLDRGPRTVTPTAVGAAVLEHARAALAAADRIEATVQEFTGLLRGHVRLGVISGAAGEEFDVAAVLAGFHTDHPAVGISLTEDTAEAMLAALDRGDLDIALVGLTGAAMAPTVGVETVLETPLVAAVAADAPPGPGEHAGTIPLRALREHRLICLPPGTGLRGVFERACAAAGFTPDIAFEAAAPPLLLRLAAHGLGTAVVPGLTPAEATAAGVRALDLVDPPLRGRLALVWRTDRTGNPAARALLGQLRLALAPRP
ncbi:LysR family transcriptional regulator [Nocardia thailandica]|uniref:LysR family transcriptional regulator n=1 Tax=Nocardia thailandica TaxID=257275 RepID=UPI0002E97F4B|nr:LysR family transcriptional regulator [Nocardia thailandica]